MVVAGSIGTYGILLMTVLLLFYMITADAYGTPMLAPFSPIVRKDLKDSLFKVTMTDLKTRPAVFKTKNKTRLKINEEAKDGQD